MKTRSRGISTSSKMTNASCSSKRLDNGWSNRLDGVERLSRQRNFSPGALIGTQKDSAYLSAPVGSGWAG